MALQHTKFRNIEGTREWLIKFSKHGLSQAMLHSGHHVRRYQIHDFINVYLLLLTASDVWLKIQRKLSSHVLRMMA